jgi:hypothetical protein
MKAVHLEILVEEFSMEAFLVDVLPKVLEGRATFSVHAYSGKDDLMAKLPSRLRGYSTWLPLDWRIVVVLDRDDGDCKQLKGVMEASVPEAFLTRSSASGRPWRIANRIAIEELEAWFFGSWAAVRGAYPRVSSTVPRQAPYRESDAVKGGTWEALERILQRGGYFRGGLRKSEIATAVGRCFDPTDCASPSFAIFREALVEAVS